MEEGTRVGAVSHGDEDVLYLFGYGVYEGNCVPAEENEPAGWIAEAIVEHEIENPKIRLDDGSVVWGCECWWGSEERIKECVSQYDEVVKLDIEEKRREYRDDE